MDDDDDMADLYLTVSNLASALLQALNSLQCMEGMPVAILCKGSESSLLADFDGASSLAAEG